MSGLEEDIEYFRGDSWKSRELMEFLDDVQDDQKFIEKIKKENKELKEFKEYVNMMVRRCLNHTCSDYEAIMAIDEKLLGEKDE